MKKLTRLSALLLVVAMLLSTAVSAIDLTGFVDYDSEHWANAALSDAVDNGLLNGYEDGTVRAEAALTRAEMATVVNRAFGATVPANVAHFADLNTDDWFYNEIAKAVQMQTFNGTGNAIEGGRHIYREEAMAVIARAMVLSDGDRLVLEQYNDYTEVSPWAEGPVSALIAKGYVNGTNMNLIEPRAYVTRAQFAQIMYNIFSDYILQSGTYSVNAERSLMINRPDVTLQNCTVNGDLVLGDGVGKGYAYISNVTVKGRILIRGGDKVTLKNVTAGEGIVVKNVNGVVNFQNYETETIFKNMVKYTDVTFLEKTPYFPIINGGTTKKYTVTFYNGDGTVLKTQQVKSGNDATAPTTVPTKAADDEWEYTFSRWDTDFENVKKNLKVYPVFSRTAREYTITLNYGGATVTTAPASINVTYNQKLSDVLPTQGFTNGTKYFAGWYYGNELIDIEKYSDIKADTLTAKWTDTFTVIFKDWDGTDLKTETGILYGTSATAPANPERAATKQYTYTFAGWDKAFDSVTSDLVVTATYTATPIYYTVTFVYDNGTANKVVEDVMYGDSVPAATDITKDGFHFAGWLVDADSSTVTTSSFTFNYEKDITLTAQWTDVFFTVEYYIPDASGGYTLYDSKEYGANVGDTVNAKNYLITIDGYAFDGTVADHLEGVVDSANTLVLKAYYKKTYTVTFYGWDNDLGGFAPISTVDGLEAGATVTNFPDYEDNKNGYRVGPGYTHKAVDAVYASNYIHKISFTWSYNNGTELEAFNEQTKIYGDIDVYPYFRKATVDIHIEKLKDKNGGNFPFYTYYDNSRVADTVKDALWNNKNAVIMAIDMTNAEDRLFEKLNEYKLIDLERKIYNQEQRIKLITIIGDENLDSFVKEEAEKNVTPENMKAFLENYIKTDADEAEELLTDLLHNASTEDIDGIFKPAITTFLEDDDNLLKEEIRMYVDTLSNDEIKELISGETAILKTYIKNNTDIVISYVEQYPTVIKDHIITNKALLKDDMIGFIVDLDNFTFLEAKLREYIKQETDAGRYDDLNELLGVSNGLYIEPESDMIVSHTTIVSKLQSALATQKDKIIDKLWNDGTYKVTILSDNTVYTTIVVPKIMEKLDELASTDIDALNTLIQKIDSTAATIPDETAYNYARATIQDKILNISDRNVVVSEVVSRISKNDIISYFNTGFESKVLNYVDSLYQADDFAALNGFFGVAGGLYSADMSLIGGYDFVTNSIVTEVKGSEALRTTIAGIIYNNGTYFAAAVDTAIGDKVFLKNAVNKAVGMDSFINTILGTDVANTAINNIIASKDDSVDNDPFDVALESVINTMISDENRDATIAKIITMLFDPNNTGLLDKAIYIVINDLKTNDVLLEDVVHTLVDYINDPSHPESTRKEMLVELVVDVWYADTIARFTKELREEEQFTVDSEFTMLIAQAMYNKYNGLSFEDFTKDISLPDAFYKVLSNETINKIVNDIYNNALTPYLAQLKAAHDGYIADPTQPYYVDTFVTVAVDPIDELVDPLYEEFRKILDEKAGDKYYYKDNPYTVALVEFLCPENLLHALDDGTYDDEIYSGYTIPTAAEIYEILYTVAVLSDDTGKWYVENVEKDKVDQVVDKLEDKILDYLNCVIQFINEYKEHGTIPKIDDLPDDKLSELLDKYNIQGIIDRNEKIQAIIKKITANQKFNNVIDKFYNSKFNRPITGEDYEKAKTALDLVFKNYNNEDWNLDSIFDEVLAVYAADFKVTDDKYEVVYDGNSASITREIVTE